MSRVTPSTPQAPQAAKVPHEKIAMRAYEKWCKRGQPQGTQELDWLEAEHELQAEANRTGSKSSHR